MTIIIRHVWGVASSAQAKSANTSTFSSLRRHEMLSAAERSLAAAAEVIHVDAEAALDDILAARALLAVLLTVGDGD